MKCPHCNHAIALEPIECSECGSIYPQEAAETLEHLRYLTAWLELNQGILGTRMYRRLKGDAATRMITLQSELRAEAVRSPEEIASQVHLLDHVLSLALSWNALEETSPAVSSGLIRLLQQRIRDLQQELDDRSPGVVPQAELEVVDFALDSLEAWSCEGEGLPLHGFERYLQEHRETLLQPPPAPVVRPVETASIKATAPPDEQSFAISTASPEARTALRTPLINWPRVWQKTVDAAASGALLRALLYLGAFMIVISAAILVVRFWHLFPAAAQLCLIAAVPTTFYLAGWQVRTRLDLPQAGNVLTGTGALLVAVDLAAVYQFGGLARLINGNAYWFGASLFCTAVYAVTAWRMQGEFFDATALLGWCSSLVAMTRLAGAHLEWSVASVVASASAMACGAVLLRVRSHEWKDTLQAARWLSLVLIPAGLVAVLFVPGETAAGQAAAFAAGTVGLGLLAWGFPAVPLAHAAAWTLAGAALFTVRALRLPLEWYFTVAAGLAPLYVSIGRRLDKELPEARWRRGYLVACQIPWIGLVAAAIIGGAINLAYQTWPGVTALSVTAAVLAWAACCLGRPRLVAFAGGLLVVPLSAAALTWMTNGDVSRSGAWLMSVWAALALCYLGLATLVRRAEDYAVWLYLLAHLLLPAACYGLLHDALTIGAWGGGPAVFGLGIVMSAYLGSAAAHENDSHPALRRLTSFVPGKPAQGIFLWPLVILLPAWLAAGWSYIPASLNWLSPLLALLALVYVGLGQLLLRRRAAYRLPFHATAYPLALAAIVLALGDTRALLVTLLINVGTLTALAWAYNRPHEAAAGSLLFIWPFQLALSLSPLTQHSYWLAYALLVIVGYTPLSRRLDRTRGQLARPVRVVGHCLAAAAVVGSLLGRFGFYRYEVRWIGALVPVLICTLQLYHLYREHRETYGWIAVLTGTIAFWQALRLINVATAYYAVAWVGLAWCFGLLERTLIRPRAGSWLERLRRPLTVAADTVCSVGLLMTASKTNAALLLGDRQNLLPLILAQCAAVAYWTFSAQAQRRRWYVHLASWLSFFPVTLGWIAYGPHLTTVQFAWPWLGWAAVLLATGFILDQDRGPVRYAHGPYLAGYILTAFALIWSATDRHTNLYTLGGAIVLALLSHVAVHRGRHRSYADFVSALWRQRETAASRTAQTAFLFFAAYAFPIWLAQLLRFNMVPLAWRGTALALVAPLYIACGLAAGRSRAEYTWPLYSAGYALTAIGAAVTYQDLELAIYVLVLDAVVFAASAVIFRRSFWLYLSTVLLPVIVLLVLTFHNLLVSRWLASALMLVAWVYLGAGRWLDWRSAILKDRHDSLSPWSIPFYVPGYGVSALALAVASGERSLAIAIYSAAVGLYALSAWSFREPLFLYPGAWLAAVPYFLVATSPPMATHWYGLAWLPLIVLYIVVGHRISRRQQDAATGLQGLVTALARPEMPFLLLAYGLSISMIALSFGSRMALTLAFIAGSVVYFGSAAAFRRRIWLYPGLLAVHAALAAFLLPSGGRPAAPAHQVALPFMLLTWATAAAGVLFDRRSAPTEEDRPRWAAALPRLPALTRLLAPRWAQPFFLVTVLDMIVWQVVALAGSETATVLAVAFALLTGMLAMLWRDGALPYGALGFLGIAAAYRHTGMTFAQDMAWLSGIGLGLYILARLVEKLLTRTDLAHQGPLAIWPRPLSSTAVLVSGAAVCLALPSVTSETSTYAIVLAFAGVLYLTVAYRGRHHRLAYLAAGMLQAAWGLLLISWDVKQPQWYAIPIGLYLVGVGTLERRLRPGHFAVSLECFGLAVLLLTSFIQSLNGAAGFPYFLLLLIEGLLVVGWGAWQQLRIPFFVGLGGSVLNVIAQVVVLVTVHEVNRWFIILGVGLLLVGSAILVERRREQLLLQAEEWRGVLESWD